MYAGAAIWNSLPYMLNMQLWLTLLNVYISIWKRLNGNGIISITTANLILYFVLI